MNKFVMITMVAFMCMNAEAAKVKISDKLIDSICMVESNGNANAIGDNGLAVGIGQIHPICVKDVNRIQKLKCKKGATPVLYSNQDRYSVSKSKEMMRIYLEFYGTQYYKNTGKIPTNEVLSRIWNGGPNGWKEKATYAYMKKVSKFLVA